MNKRVFIRKKDAFQIESQSLLSELKESLKEDKITGVDLYNIYDVFNIKEEDYILLKSKVLSEIVTDEIIEELDLKDELYIATEFLPGQYDQRGDWAGQCLDLLGSGEDVIIKSGKLIVINGEVNSLERIKKYLINPIESREKSLDNLLVEELNEIKPVEYYVEFNEYTHEMLEEFKKNNSLGMTVSDLIHIQDYFKNIEKRVPRETEIKLLDTYWSDHCRHTTFETALEKVKICDGELQDKIQKSYEKYINIRKKLNRDNKPITLMDIATIGARYIKSIGGLEDLEDTKENNACSIEIDVDVDGKTEKYLLMFKNETHNHPTEIEPFGGASTCIGGAIRDPLSGRAYVYQAMRISGSGDITESIDETIPNKLPQKTISTGAAKGNSSYGNQIGVPTSFVKEIYHPGYKAKHMEVGAVVGAVKKSNVRREEPIPGDLVIVLGGRTGRDGIGGATGSSKEHDNTSLERCGSEVQKGNAPIERKIQRLFRNPKVTKLIKKSNDFGAGGVSVAIGEIAEGVTINLDNLLVKYEGLNGTELALSESQERMAVVIGKEDREEFFKYMEDENLEGTVLAEVTEEKRLVMFYKNEKIVDIARSFLDTNGVRQTQNVVINSSINRKLDLDLKFNKENLEKMLSSLNVATQRGMSEMFDYSVGRGTVLLPYGGNYQETQSEASVQKIATDGFTNTCSILAYGYNPLISEISPYLSSSYAVIESLCKVTAVGGDYKKVRLSFQEYFEKLGTTDEKWGKPTMALLGALDAQLEFRTPAIGGKDSMSGTFNNIDVPPTLISFAVTTENVENIVSKEFKSGSKYVYLVEHTSKIDACPNYSQLKENMEFIRENIINRKINAVGVISFGGWAETICKMGLGNRILGGDFTSDINPLEMKIGSFIIATSEKILGSNLSLLGELKNNIPLRINGVEIEVERIKELLEERFKKIYPYFSETNKNITNTVLKQENIIKNSVENLENKVENYREKKAQTLYDNPKVLIMTFPGTNSEYDTEKAFKRVGAETEIFVFNNLNKERINKSIDSFVNKLSNSQILMIPGGFSAGDEPDGSGKYIANILQNEKISKGIREFLNNEGLILGICNGFQGLIKSGLLPYGDTKNINENSPVLFRNDINRHISRMIDTKIMTNNSPWLSSFKRGDIHKLSVSHGEGKFVVSEELYLELLKNNQIATRYCDENGEVTMDSQINVNGSYYGVEGILSPCGQIFGKMAHSERYENGLYKNIQGEKLQDIFANGVNFFRK